MAGIVIGVLISVIIIAAVVFVIRKGYAPCGPGHFHVVPHASGYDNALYIQEQNRESGEVTGEVKLSSSDSDRLNATVESQVTVHDS